MAHILLREDWGSIRRMLLKEKAEEIEDNMPWFRIYFHVDFFLIRACSKTYVSVYEKQSLFINFSGSVWG